MVLSWPGVRVDLAARAVERPGAAPARLTPTEVDALAHLAARAGAVVARAELEREVWGYREGLRSEAVPVAMRRLRAKLDPDVLQTVPGVGWLLARPLADPPAAILPGYGTPYLPRPADEEAVRAWWARGQRLVSLVGPGGAGKTRLAVHLASASGRWCRLADLSRAEVPALVRTAEALGVDLSDPATLGRVIEHHGPALVVLDNAEGRIGEVAALASELLRAAPGALLLVTSRIRLGSPDEAVHEVGPLPPETARALLRARIAAAGGAADDEAIDPLVDALDRLPLAIELCAARMGASRAADPAGLFADAAPGRPPRSASLAAVVQWSWDLLDEPARELLARSAVFPGRFDEAAAAAVLADPEAPAPEALALLADHHLLQRIDGGYRLLHTVRRGVAALRAVPDAVRARHAEWATEQASAAASALEREPIRSRARLIALRDDLELAIEHGTPLHAARAALALDRVRMLDGDLVERESALLRLVERGPPEPWRSYLLLRAGSTAMERGLPERARALLDQIVPDETDEALAPALWLLDARLQLAAGDRTAALASVDRAKAVSSSSPRQVRALMMRGAILAELGQREEADADLEAAHGICRREGLLLVLPAVVSHRAALRRDSDPARARLWLEEAIAAARTVEHGQFLEAALYHLGAATLGEDPAAAAARFTEASHSLRSRGALWMRAEVDGALGVCRWLLGDTDGALRILEPLDAASPGLLPLAVLAAARAETGSPRLARASLDRCDPGSPDELIGADRAATLLAWVSDLVELSATRQQTVRERLARRLADTGGDDALLGAIRHRLRAAAGCRPADAPSGW